jgi:23S rRNA (pseudouridine1915-N3)-methyltransferase
MKGVKCIFVGKLKETWALYACEHYAEALRRYHKVEQVTVKDAPGSLPEQRRREEEGIRILDKTGPADLLIALDERGMSMSSPDLATKLRGWIEDPGKRPCFIVGGAFGLSRKVLDRADFRLSLGPMTLPHELARVVLLEQIYRASTILSGAPYHH